MIYQLRIYSIKEGRMEEWLEYFQSKLVPLSNEFGIKVLRGWVCHERNQFVWMRGFEGPESIEEQERAYYASPGRSALGDEPIELYIDNMDVRIIEPLFDFTTS